MKLTGTLFLAKATPYVDRTPAGDLRLTLNTVDRIGPHRVEAWRLVWIGDDAQSFWVNHANELQPGAALHVTAEHVRSYEYAVGQPSVLTANVRSIHITETTHV